MLGEGEGLELLGVFITFILGLGLMVAFGKWWESQLEKKTLNLFVLELKQILGLGRMNGFK